MPPAQSKCNKQRLGRERAQARYRQLRPRPHGASAEDVAAHQRGRIFGAMVEAVAERGYAALTVAELTRMAGVSKRTFYEQFANKQDCFLTTYERILDCALSGVEAARCSDVAAGSPYEELRRVLAALASAAAEYPDEARLALVAAPAAGPAALARVDAARLGFQRIVVRDFEGVLSPVAGAEPKLDPATRRTIATCALGVVYGYEHLLRRSLLASHVAASKVSPADGLADWAMSYCSPAIRKLGATPAGQTPIGMSHRPRLRFRGNDERTRILCATADLAAGRGFASLTMAGICARAGVSEREFEANYENTDGCLLDALDLVGLETLISAAASQIGRENPLGAVCAAIAALMDYASADPLVRGLILVNTLAWDSAGIERRERVLGRFADVLAHWLLPTSLRAGLLAHAAVGAVWGIVRHHVVDGTASLLPSLAGQAAYLVLAPIAGPERAMRAILAEQRACRPP